MKRIFFFFFFSVMVFSHGVLGGEAPSHTLATYWKLLAPGLSFLRWPIPSPNSSNNTLAILRIDPELWSFRVFFNREPKTVQEWQQNTGAAVICNGGFYQETFDPAGRILVNGVSLGPYRNRHMKGMFLAEPKKGLEQLPKALLIDLKNPKSEEMMASYDQGIQSFPVLLDANGQVRVNPSSFQAHRTVIAQDQGGAIYIIVTEKPLFTLFDLGNYLKNLSLGFRFVLNLDGGSRTQLLIHLGEYKYYFSGQSEGSQPARLFFPESAKLPSVIGIFPRGRR